MASFPLHCSICPGNHIYTDVSHMLTHVSSKGHLSAHFHASIRASQDLVIAQKLHEYDCWFRENDLAYLLAERIHRKDEKRSRVKKAAEEEVVYKIEDGDENDAEETKMTRIPPHRPSKTSQPPIDPALGVKQEEFENEDEPEQLSIEHQLEPWPTQQSGHTEPEAFHQQLPYSWHSSTALNHNQSPYAFGPVVVRPNLDGLFSQSQRALTSNATSSSALGEPNEFTPLKGNGSRLKGVVFPGMGIFDAADADGKRMRNQRKSYEVSDILERQSELITPVETIRYVQDWQVREDREIDGEVHSPLPAGMESPIKPKPRAVLLNKSTNKKIGTASRGRSGKRGRGQDTRRAGITRRSANNDLETSRPSVQSRAAAPAYSRSNWSHHASPPGFNVYRDTYNARQSLRSPGFSPYDAGYDYLREDQHSAYQITAPAYQSHGCSPVRASNRSTYPSAEISPIRFDALPDLQPTMSNIRAQRHVYGYQSRENHMVSPSSIPPLGLFGNSRSVLSPVSASAGTRTHVQQRGRHSGQRTTQQSGGNATTRPIAQIRDSAEPGVLDFSSNNANDQSSGDETIDLGLDSSPTRYLTRSVTRAGFR